MPPADPAAMPAWTASGRLALASRDQGGSGSFTWEQDRDLTTLSIRGPLGAGALQVIADGPALSIVDADGHSVDTGQARTALRDRLGADLPWQHLRYWMLGVPSPAEPGSVATSPQPPLRVIEQSGWRVGYEAFEPAGGAWLPVRFTATQGAVRLKVVVDDWAVAGARGRQR
jgi:outer membrane lipoprotein LolB